MIKGVTRVNYLENGIESQVCAINVPKAQIHKKGKAEALVPIIHADSSKSGR